MNTTIFNNGRVNQIGPSAKHFSFCASAAQMPVDEFRAIIRIDAQQPKGQNRFDLVQGLDHSCLSPPTEANKPIGGSVWGQDENSIRECHP
jgi:hypothetical protein